MSTNIGIFMKCIRVKVYGEVQGVSFRSFIKQAADELGLVGWIRNNRDGSVEAVVERQQDKIEALLAKMRKGPPNACVTGIEIEPENSGEEFKGFQVKKP
jgi:acylphosphatase